MELEIAYSRFYVLKFYTVDYNKINYNTFLNLL